MGILSLLFTDDVLLLASSNRDLQQPALRLFAAKSEAGGMRISNSKFRAVVLSWKRVEWPLWVRNELLPQVMEFVLCFVREWGEWCERLADRLVPPWQ